MLSVYTSVYNTSIGLYDWRPQLLKFRDFASELVVATTTDCKDNTVEELKGFCLNNGIKLVVTDILFSNLAFDGCLKNAALQGCTKDACSLLDIDETPYNKESWYSAAKQLLNSNFDALMVPVLDLIRDSAHFKGNIGAKWYIHKNHKGLQRGVVNFAKKPDGTIDITKSDSTELISASGDLVSAAYLMNPSLSDEEKLTEIKKNKYPFVAHDWGTSFTKRIERQKYWNPVWKIRGGQEVKTVNTIEELAAIPFKKHNLF